MWILTLTAAASAQSACEATVADLQTYADYALEGLASGDEDLYYNSDQSLTLELPCADGPLPAPLVARLHLLYAHRVAEKGAAPEDIDPALRAARAADPVLGLPAPLQAGPLGDRWSAAAPEIAPPPTLQALPEGAWWVDGVSAGAAPTDRPAVVQCEGGCPDGAARRTWYVEAGALPPELIPTPDEAPPRLAPRLELGADLARGLAAPDRAAGPGLGPRAAAGLDLRLNERLRVGAGGGYHAWSGGGGDARFGYAAVGPSLDLGALRLEAAGLWGLGAGSLYLEGDETGWDVALTVVGAQIGASAGLLELGRRLELAGALTAGGLSDGEVLYPWVQLGARLQGR